MKIVLLPNWVRRALEFNNLPLSAAADLNKLATILSPDDVAHYIFMNQRVADYTWPSFALGNFGNVLGVRQSEWSEKVSASFDYLNIKGPRPLVESWLGRGGIEGTTLDFVSDMVGDDLIIITPIECSYEASKDKVGTSKHAFYDRLVGQLLTVTTMEELSTQGIFKQYLDSIQVLA